MLQRLFLGKVFNEVKERPLYIVKDVINLEQSKNAEPVLTTAAYSR